MKNIKDHINSFHVYKLGLHIVHCGKNAKGTHTWSAYRQYAERTHVVMFSLKIKC